MRAIFLISISLIITISCSNPEGAEIENITDISDYRWALDEVKKGQTQSEQKEKIEKEITFWKDQIISKGDVNLYRFKLGGLYSELFECTGNINYIHEANDHYKRCANTSTGTYKGNVLLALSSNHIKLHQFSDALSYCEQSYELSKNKVNPALMTFDAAMELGKYQLAEDIMDQYSNPESFDYLVRYSKYADANGDLSEAIRSMEKAHLLVKGSNKEWRDWSLSSLAEMYGHNGEIEKSYATFLSILKDNPTDLHALKNIAWIAYSYDGNVDAAKKILSTIAQVTQLPDADYMMAEILEGAEGETYKSQFVHKAERKEHYNLYKSYLVDLYLEDDSLIGLAHKIAIEEVNHRPTPETYLLLAKVKYRQGNDKGAKEILHKKVIGHTYEPNIIYESATILKSLGDMKSAKKLFTEIADAGFELGPVKAKQISTALKTI